MANENKMVGVLGAGSFGTALSYLLSTQSDVMVFTRREAVLNSVNDENQLNNTKLPKNVRATSDYEAFAAECPVIFPVVPSKYFREMMQEVGQYLRPYHILIHGTKGLDAYPIPEEDDVPSKSQIFTMSQVIKQESPVVKVGCLSGPNLAEEILEGQPAATVIASKFNEVIEIGQSLLKSTHFHVFGSHQIYGAELAGVFKNVFAIASGILGGQNLGYNLRALLITRGLVEMIHLGRAMGAEVRPFLGTAGMGDLIATASTTKSRNYTVGFRLGKGETLKAILKDLPEVAEGVRTLQIIKGLADELNVNVPITQVVYRILYKQMPVEKAMQYLMSYPYAKDVDFL